MLKFKIESTETLEFNLRYYFIYSIVGVLIAIFLFYLGKLYDFKNLYAGMGENARITSSIFLSVFMLIALNYYFNRNTYQLSRMWLIYVTMISIILIIVSRIIARRLFFSFLARRGIVTNILIVGVNEEGRRIADTFSKNERERINVVGFVDKENLIEKYKMSNSPTENIKIMGGLNELESIIKKFNIDRVIFSSHELKYFDIFNIFEKIKDLNVEVQISPFLFEFSTSRMKMFEYVGIPLIQIQKVEIGGVSKFIKLVIDYVIGIALFIIFVILYPIVGVLIKVDSPGLVLYKQGRYGKNFKKINIYKFRTMIADADKRKEYIEKIYKREKDFKIKNDPRITRVGRFLRKTSLDELPQVLNVLKGELSVVGPRALAIKEGDLLKDWEKKRMKVNQGITGLWQVSGRSDLTYEERMKLDLYYIQNWSIWLELKIIILTVFRMFFGKGAY